MLWREAGDLLIASVSSAAEIVWKCVFEGVGTLGVTHQKKKKNMMGNEKGEEEQGGGGMGTILQLFPDAALTDCCQCLEYWKKTEERSKSLCDHCHVLAKVEKDIVPVCKLCLVFPVLML